MYYAARQHITKPVINAVDAARIISTGQASTLDALIWRNTRNERIAAVDDGHIDDPWGEIAIINLDRNIQIESITFDQTRLGEWFTECEDYEEGGISNLPLDGSNEDTRTIFECSCCGSHFYSTLTIQKRYDQDAGYGRCEKCA